MGKYGVKLDEIIERATYKAIKIYEKEKIIDQRKKVLHNTKLLMKHYNDLKEHAESAVETISEINFNDCNVVDLDKDDLYILSIKRSKIKTLIMISHIDASLALLEQKQMKLNTIYKYDALEMFYIQEKSYEDIQEKLSCGKNTPARWINQMLNELSILLFGVDGIRDLG